VTGKTGALVPRTLAKEVDGDAVRVDGSEASVRALASSLGAKVSGAGPWELRAPGIFASLAHQGSVGALEGVSRVEALDVRAPAVAEAARAAGEGGEARAFSASDPRFAGFEGLGARAPVCGDPLAGTWVSAPQHLYQWHVFTLHVEPGAKPGQLAGTVSAHVWSGGAEEEPPAACGEADMDVRVSMAATGLRAQDGSVRFDAGPWRLDGSSCTPDVQGWSYNPDHFSGLTQGGAIRSLNNDGGDFVNVPTAFERVSCE
jgi:hypothetical protein